MFLLHLRFSFPPSFAGSHRTSPLWSFGRLTTHGSYLLLTASILRTPDHQISLFQQEERGSSQRWWEPSVPSPSAPASRVPPSCSFREFHSRVFSFSWCKQFWSLYWICYNTASVLCFGFFGQEACGILAPQSGIKPMSPALEGEVLLTGPPGKSL